VRRPFSGRTQEKRDVAANAICSGSSDAIPAHTIVADIAFADGAAAIATRFPDLYPWHPWSSQFVQVHEALAKRTAIFCCSLSGASSDRLVEVPEWMFD